MITVTLSSGRRQTEIFEYSQVGVAVMARALKAAAKHYGYQPGSIKVRTEPERLRVLLNTGAGIHDYQIQALIDRARMIVEVTE